MKIIQASSQPFSKGEGLKNVKAHNFGIQVLSFGEDLGEANERLFLLTDDVYFSGGVEVISPNSFT